MFVRISIFIFYFLVIEQEWKANRLNAKKNKMYFYILYVIHNIQPAYIYYDQCCYCYISCNLAAMNSDVCVYF